MTFILKVLNAYLVCCPEALAPPTVPQGSLLSLPSHGASVTVPDHLLQTCRLQPVIFNGMLMLFISCSNVS